MNSSELWCSEQIKVIGFERLKDVGFKCHKNWLKGGVWYINSRSNLLGVTKNDEQLRDVMQWTTQGFDAMNSLGLWCNAQLKVVDAMNESRTWALYALKTTKKGSAICKLLAKPLKGNQSNEQLTSVNEWTT